MVIYTHSYYSNKNITKLKKSVYRFKIILNTFSEHNINSS